MLALATLFAARRIGRLTKRLEESESRNRHLASHDMLTGLANRLQFDAALTEALGRLPEVPFAIVACDLDRFKAVNDTYGHAAGDVVIRTVGGRFRDVIGTAGLAARIGGDEFIALIAGHTDRTYLETLCRQAIAAMSAPIAVTDDVTTDIGASMGIVTAHLAGTNKTKLLAAADRALYAAKSSGRGQYAFAGDSEAAAGGADRAEPAAPAAHPEPLHRKSRGRRGASASQDHRIEPCKG